MNIVHVAPITFNQSSGVSTIVPQIVINQNKIKDVNVKLINTANIDEKKFKKQINNFTFEYYSAMYCKPKNFRNYFFTNQKPDLVIFHGVYNLNSATLANYLNKNKIPYVVVPHGGMTVKSQNKSKIKKKIANNIFFNKFVKNASKVQYLSNGEAESSSKWSKEYIVVGNGIDKPKIIHNKTNKRINFTFIGRLDIETKGLDILLETVLLAKKVLEYYNVELNIYGPDENGSRSKIFEYITKHKLKNIVNVRSSVYGKEKEKIYENTDFFLLFSRHEGLPTTVLEALSYGVPCLLTPGTNLSEEVESNECGWRVEGNPNKIAKKLEFILKEFGNYENYSINAKKFISERYSWDEITKKTLSEYNKLI